MRITTSSTIVTPSSAVTSTRASRRARVSPEAMVITNRPSSTMQAPTIVTTRRSASFVSGR